MVYCAIYGFVGEMTWVQCRGWDVGSWKEMKGNKREGGVWRFENVF